MKKYITEPSRQTPIAANYDVIVVGGGIAGVASAISAARNGAKTCIIEKEHALGGLATLGNIVIYLPICDGMGNLVSSGLSEELLKLSIADGFDKIPQPWLNKKSKIAQRKKNRYMVTFNPASYILALEELVLKNNIEIRYDSRFCDLHKNNNKIDSIIIEDKSGRRALTCKAVVDASGDADVCARASEKTLSLNTNTASNWYYTTDNKSVKLHHISKPFLRDPSALPKSAKRGYAGDIAEDVSAMNIDGRKLVRKHLTALQRKKPNDNILPVTLSLIPNFRMTRRLKTSSEITLQHNKIYFNDTIGLIPDWRKPGPIIHLPFTALAAPKTHNLLVAGRCIAVGNSVWDMTRAIPGCAVTGQAAGTAAAIVAHQNTPTHKLNIKSLQNQLRTHHALITDTYANPHQ